MESIQPKGRHLNMDKTVVFLTPKGFISVSFFVASYKQGMRNQVLQRNLKWKKSLKKQKR